MNLKTVYEGISVGTLGDYPTEDNKTRFGLRGMNFCRGAAKLAGVTLDKGYPYHNKGGIAGLGEVYCNISHPSNKEVLEICLAESTPYYRTNGPRGYGNNVSMGREPFSGKDILEEWTEEKLAEVIRKFMAG